VDFATLSPFWPACTLSLNLWWAIHTTTLGLLTSPCATRGARDESLIVPNPKTKGSAQGFTVIPRRWVVERSIAWITRWRRLARDHEGLPETSEAFIKLSASRRMLSHLAPVFPAAVLG